VVKKRYTSARKVLGNPRVETKEALLVMDKARAQEAREIVKIIRR